ncbi:MAG: globin [Candidatus Marinarcus sp.]|uniref:globin domain-containing protein n=1 Tax=Candidatus Marinarcus sp. TaxID=3100987 RepID=UPI003B008B5F
MHTNQPFVNLKNEPINEIKSFGSCDITQKFHAQGVKPSMIDFVYPPVPFPPKAIFEEFGEENIINMVSHHHGLLKKSAIKDLFTKDEKEFEIVNQRAAEFFMEALGGGERYTSKHGHPHLRSRHFPFTIDEHGRDVWLMFYKKTLKDVNFPKKHIQAFWEWIESMSLRMINRRTTMEPPMRYPFETIAHEFDLGAPCEN